MLHWAVFTQAPKWFLAALWTTGITLETLCQASSGNNCFCSISWQTEMKVSFKHAHIQGLEPVTYSAYTGRNYINTIRFKDAETGTMF